jgi:hypothetical protein
MKMTILGVVLIICGFVGTLFLILHSTTISETYGFINGSAHYMTYIKLFGIGAYLNFAKFIFFAGVALCVADIIFNNKKKK